MSGKFHLVSSFAPAGDQPKAVKALLDGLQSGERQQILLGVTGSGKTFTMAQVIAGLNRPTLVISPNKILAAQLYAEFKQFFPGNAVEYFISYYDYYQPEAYVPQTDTYIEKDASINEHIDRLRLRATTALLERRDVIVVASVSCIYGLGSPRDFREMCTLVEKGRIKNRELFLTELINMRYERNNLDLQRGRFRVRGETVDVYPAYQQRAYRIELFGDEVERISEFDPVSGKTYGELERLYIYPTTHFVTPRPQLEKALVAIKEELTTRLVELRQKGKLLEAQRLEQRTNFDLEMLAETNFCHGVENYSRHLAGRLPGERPACLIDYFPDDLLLFIDESHVAVPQIRGMYEGDHSRKLILVNYGFRLPSALDNRPLKFSEFESLINQIVYVSATPGEYELRRTNGKTVEQIIRPTGLVDPPVIVKPTYNQVEDLIGEIKERIKNKERVLVTTLTKRMAEDLAEYLSSKNLKVKYLHSEIDALTRVEILKDLRKGNFDVLVGINLLREGLDLPEVSLVAVLDADKEGFLRSETTLIQISGRAARNLQGKVILYADKITGSIQRALQEMERRRQKQLIYNEEYKITPRSIVKAIQELEEFQYRAKKQGLKEIREQALPYAQGKKEDILKILREWEEQMREAADSLDFETAVVFRDRIFELRQMLGEKKQTTRVRLHKIE